MTRSGPISLLAKAAAVVPLPDSAVGAFRAEDGAGSA
jgi:hypothetical protein